MESSATFAGFGVVPDIGDIDFDLGSLDTFDDMDIDMESFNLINDTTASTDPFGNLSFEQSLDLVDFNNDNLNSICSETANILDDFDVKETIKQDCMWSAFQDQAVSCRNRSVHIKHKKSRSSAETGSHVISLTPPSSYINDHLRSFDTPLPSDDESCEEVDVVNPSSSQVCSRLQMTSDPMSSDHCYTSMSPQPWGENTSASAPLTPPESSEDEESSQGSTLYSPASSQLDGSTSKAIRKTGLSHIENDRFNKVVKSILLNTSNKLQTKESSSGKAKFTFSITTKKCRKTLVTPTNRERGLKNTRRRQDCSTSKSYQISSIKENKQKSSSTHFTKAKSRARTEVEEPKSRSGKSDHKEARDVHNQMERQRRQDLKNAYDSLKEFVPTIANSDRASKQMVLDKAIDYCKTLKGKETSVREQKKRIQQRNEALRKRLALIESQMTSCQLENAHWEIQGW